MHSPSGDADVISDAGLPGEHDGRITKRDVVVLLCIRSELPQHLVAVSGLWSRRVPPLASCRFLAAALQWKPRHRTAIGNGGRSQGSRSYPLDCVPEREA